MRARTCPIPGAAATAAPEGTLLHSGAARLDRRAS